MEKLSFFISLSLHLVLWVTFIHHTGSKSPLPKTTIEVEFVKRQIVEQTTAQNLKRPQDKKAFLGAFDQSVSSQTKARQIGAFQNGGSSQNKKLKKSFHLGPAWKTQETSTNDHRLSQTDDFLPDTPEGPTTQLNTYKFAFYTYYHSIRQQLRPLWHQKIRSLYRHASFQNKARNFTASPLSTKLVIWLNSDGSIWTIEVLSSSGESLLDQAAVQAFHDAAPFPNPPSQIQKNGKVRLEWQFVLQT